MSGLVIPATSVAARRAEAVREHVQGLYELNLHYASRTNRLMAQNHEARLRAFCDRLDDETYEIQARGRPNAVWPGSLADTLRPQIPAIVQAASRKAAQEHASRTDRRRARGSALALTQDRRPRVDREVANPVVEDRALAEDQPADDLDRLFYEANRSVNELPLEFAHRLGRELDLMRRDRDRAEERFVAASTTIEQMAARSSAPASAYPYDDGGATVLGPDVIATADEGTISWHGETYFRGMDAAAFVRGQREAAQHIVDLQQRVDGLVEEVASLEAHETSFLRIRHRLLDSARGDGSHGVYVSQDALGDLRDLREYDAAPWDAGGRCPVCGERGRLVATRPITRDGQTFYTGRERRCSCIPDGAGDMLDAAAPELGDEFDEIDPRSLYSLAFQVAGATSAVFMAEQPHLEMPGDEIRDRVVPVVERMTGVEAPDGYRRREQPEDDDA